jgi:hypothetical protein
MFGVSGFGMADDLRRRMQQQPQAVNGNPASTTVSAQPGTDSGSITGGITGASAPAAPAAPTAPGAVATAASQAQPMYGQSQYKKSPQSSLFGPMSTLNPFQKA